MPPTVAVPRRLRQTIEMRSLLPTRTSYRRIHTRRRRLTRGMVEVSSGHRRRHHSTVRLLLAKIALSGSLARRMRQGVQWTNQWQPLPPSPPAPPPTCRQPNKKKLTSFARGCARQMTLPSPGDPHRKEKPQAAAAAAAAALVHPRRRPLVRAWAATSDSARQSWRRRKSWRGAARSPASARRRGRYASWQTW